jgi:hypothetical protein
MNRINRRGAMLAKALAAGVLMASAGMAMALPFSAFEGRNADGSVNTTCTASGSDKCIMIYDSNLNITFLNNWNIGAGTWDGSVTPAVGSAQALAEDAGFAATGLTGWRLPTGDDFNFADKVLNELRALWTDVNGTFAGLESEFDGVHRGNYWTGSAGIEAAINKAWVFDAGSGGNGGFGLVAKSTRFSVVAVRSGDVVAAVPEPESLALVLIGLVAAGVTRRRRPF